jgi:hypothetical protein
VKENTILECPENIYSSREYQFVEDQVVHLHILDVVDVLHVVSTVNPHGEEIIVVTNIGDALVVSIHLEVK